MNPILAKFADEQNPESHGGKLLWPGGPTGLPVRLRPNETPRLHRQEELDDMVNVGSFKHRLFRMNDPNDAAEYDWVMDRILGQWFTLIHRHLVPNPNSPEVIWYVEWSQNYSVQSDRG